jgi:phosphatidylinositol glycan class B
MYCFTFSTLSKQAIVPFLIVHFITPHKELRFLFPLVIFIPLMLIASSKFVIQKMPILKKNVIIHLFLAYCVLLNLISFFAAIISPVDDGRINITHYIYEKFRDERIVLWHAKSPIPTDQCFILSRVTMRITLSDELFLTA